MKHRVENRIWMIFSLLRHRWIWLIGIFICLYGIVLPCQKNILDFYKDYHLAASAFWGIIRLFHPILALLLIFQGALQLYQPDQEEVVAAARPKKFLMLSGIWFLFELICIPSWIWYGSIYPDAGIRIGSLALFGMGYGLEFGLILKLGRHPLAAFVLSMATVLLVETFLRGTAA